MPGYAHANRAGIRAAFALVILIILGLAWLIRFAVRAVGITGPHPVPRVRPEGGS